MTAWGYDGTPGLGTTPRLYNQIAVKIASERGTNAIELARLLALINVGMADAALACWASKFAYTHWRPITAIRRTFVSDEFNGIYLGIHWSYDEAGRAQGRAIAEHMLANVFQPR